MLTESDFSLRTITTMTQIKNWVVITVIRFGAGILITLLL
jgi:hypothetical protein